MKVREEEENTKYYAVQYSDKFGQFPIHVFDFKRRTNWKGHAYHGYPETLEQAIKDRQAYLARKIGELESELNELKRIAAQEVTIIDNSRASSHD